MASTVHLGGRDVSSGAEASGGGKSATADPVTAAAAGLGAAATCLLLAAGYAWVLGEVFLPEAPASALRFVPHLLTLYTAGSGGAAVVAPVGMLGFGSSFVPAAWVLLAAALVLP